MRNSGIMRDRVKKTLVLVASPFLGAGGGYLYSLYGKVSSAAISVRPELVNVNCINAFLSGYLTNLFYRHPKEATTASVAVGAIIAVLAAYFLTKHYYD